VAGWRRLSNVFVLLVLFIVPWGSILTIDGSYRRSLGMLPALVIAMALPLASVWRWADARPVLPRIAAGSCIVAVVALVCVTNTNYFFDRMAVSPIARFTYAEEIAAASRYMNETQPDRVYFLSGRWTYNYETRRFIAPDIPGEDRSKEWSANHQVDLTPDRTQDVLYIFIGHYVEYLPDVQSAYPEGRPYNGIHDGRLLFAAYFLPKHPLAAAAPSSAPQ
jgi:hypothetical protein